MLDTNRTAFFLVSKDGVQCAAFAKKDDAEAKAAKYNADPFIEEGSPDPDAPYRVEVGDAGNWCVR